MSTLQYLDEKGSVRNFGLVPWATLNTWLSAINGFNLGSGLPRGTNRGKIIEELEARRKSQPGRIVGSILRLIDRGAGKDWREYENDGGYTHLEELLIFQPNEWRKQAREYFFYYDCDLSRQSSNEKPRTLIMRVKRDEQHIFMCSPILVVLFHWGIAQTARYEPLNFLLAYGVKDPLPSILKDLPESRQEALKEHLSPLDFFLEFQKSVESYRLETLHKIGKAALLPRLCLIKELDFSSIIGQRSAKKLIRQSVVSHVWNRTSGKEGGMCVGAHPLSMIFAGPSGNGKTELAEWLAKLMNNPGDDSFIKVDCGKLTDAGEIFGMSGAYQGAMQGSALNNFVMRMSLEPQAVGIVLLDEIEKAGQSVIHALYQVIDKGEWTNKRLGSSGSQTDVIKCHNLIFIMTTNACDRHIVDYVKRHPKIYNAVGDELNGMESDLSSMIRKTLQYKYPFTEAFLGRVGRIVPFLPLATGDPDLHGILHGESLTVAKLLIERQLEKFSDSSIAGIKQAVSPRDKDNIAKLVVKDVIPEAGVRGIQKSVEQKMGDRVLHSFLLEEGGIEGGSCIRYFMRAEAEDIDFRVEDLQALNLGEDSEEEYDMAKQDADVFG